uniref:Uncharacterized protein n=1 Tax=Timema bartmani TaxID=61472 RepID=A0A7R9I1X0_9NEOP|nr:unnamed protein product [Timema bartmani]
MYLNLDKGGVEKHKKTTLSAPSWDSTLDLSVFGRQVKIRSTSLNIFLVSRISIALVSFEIEKLAWLIYHTSHGNAVPNEDQLWPDASIIYTINPGIASRLASRASLTLDKWVRQNARSNPVNVGISTNL